MLMNCFDYCYPFLNFHCFANVGRCFEDLQRHLYVHGLQHRGGAEFVCVQHSLQGNVMWEQKGRVRKNSIRTCPVKMSMVEHPFII